MGTSSAWTPERRAKQAENIRRWKPWASSTGPTTPEGKAITSRNAYKGAHREYVRSHQRVMRAKLELLELLVARTGVKPYSGSRQRRSDGRVRGGDPRYEEALADVWGRVESLERARDHARIDALRALYPSD